MPSEKMLIVWTTKIIFVYIKALAKGCPVQLLPKYLTHNSIWLSLLMVLLVEVVSIIITIQSDTNSVFQYGPKRQIKL